MFTLELLINVTNKLEASQPFELVPANRNLWALGQLNVNHEKLVERLEQILKYKKEQITEQVVVNYFSVLAK